MNTINAEPQAVLAPDLWLTLLKSVAMLCVVLGILIGLLLLMKRFLDSRGSHAERGIIKVLASYYIAPKERIMLIEVLGERILIGVTPQSINRLATIANDREMEVRDRNAPSGFFLNLLKGKTAKEAHRYEKKQ